MYTTLSILTAFWKKHEQCKVLNTNNLISHIFNYCKLVFIFYSEKVVVRGLIWVLWFQCRYLKKNIIEVDTVSHWAVFLREFETFISCFTIVIKELVSAAHSVYIYVTSKLSKPFVQYVSKSHLLFLPYQGQHIMNYKRLQLSVVYKKNSAKHIFTTFCFTDIKVLL